MTSQEVQTQSLAGKVAVYVTYDTDDATIDEDIDGYRVVYDLPAGETVRVNILRTKTGRVWRTTDLTGQGEWGADAPFGAVKKVGDLQFELVSV